MAKHDAADRALLKAAECMPEKTLRLVCEIKAARVEAAPKYPGVYADPALLAELQKSGARRFGPEFSEHQRQ